MQMSKVPKPAYNKQNLRINIYKKQQNKKIK